MPQADVFYTADLTFDETALFDSIENTLSENDENAGLCKCRAYQTNSYNHTSILISIKMMPKPYRNDAFAQKLLGLLEPEVKKHIKQPCNLSLLIEFNLKNHITNKHLS